MRLINRTPTPRGLMIAVVAPFAILLAIYATVSIERRVENPDDKLLPGITAMAEAVNRLAFEPDRRSGDYLFWKDTIASLERLALGVGIAAALGIVFGIANGLLPWFSASGSPLIKMISLIPPLAILPILFIVFGVGELAKVALIVIGTAPFLMRDLEQRVGEIPREQIIKSQTLDATTWQIVLRVVLPQMMPRLIDAVRLSLGAAWLFLIAAEAIASTEGLGYRIFLVRRYLAMDVILPYVAWITLLAFLLDYALRQINRRAFPWYGAPA